MIILPTMRGLLSGFSPLSLSPALWLDASDASTLYDATSGGSLVAADGAVARWEDKSGNSRHATQATSGNRPLRKTSIANGRAVLLFDGSNDYLSTVAFAGSQTWTRFIVAANLSQSQYKVLCGWGSAFDTPNPGADYIAVNSGKIEWIQNGGASTTKLSSYTSNSANSANGTFLVLSQACDGTHAGNVLLRNGTAPAATANFSNAPGTLTKSSTAYGLGAFNGGSLPVNAYIAEVLHFNAALTAGQQTQMRNYLGAKYGVAVS